MLEKIFGASYKTSVSAIFTAIGLVPVGIYQLGLTEIPDWLRVVGVVCSFIAFIYMGVKSKATDVTGAGNNAVNVETVKDNQDSLNSKNQIGG